MNKYQIKDALISDFNDVITDKEMLQMKNEVSQVFNENKTLNNKAFTELLQEKYPECEVIHNAIVRKNLIGINKSIKTIKIIIIVLLILSFLSGLITGIMSGII